MDDQESNQLYQSLWYGRGKKQKEKFIKDLNIYEVFLEINCTKTIIGSQYLFHTLCNPVSSSKDLNILEREIEYFEENKQLKDAFNSSCAKIKNPNTYLLPELFFSEKLVPPKYFKIAPYLLGIELLLFVLSYFSLTMLAVLLPLLFVNTFIHLVNKSRLYLFKRTYLPVSELLESVKMMKGKDGRKMFYNDDTEKAVSALSPLRVKLIILGIADYFSSSEMFMIPFVLIEIVKTVTLFEVLLTKNLVMAFNERKQEIKLLYEVTGKVDSVNSIATLRNSLELWCKPIFLNNAEKSCHVENVYHPLIDNPEKNSICLSGKSIIIAGSNMSGKTTFLRTIAINNVLAQTINTCLAGRFEVPFLKTVTSLHNLDSIIEGESFYFAEANNLLNLIRPEGSVKALIVLDEIFKGTNSLERTAISKATLDYLHNNCGIVFASTHDMSLINLVNTNYEPYHFNEVLDGSKIVLDYKIKKGKLYVFNAIKTLTNMGFPELLTRDAQSTFDVLKQ